MSGPAMDRGRFGTPRFYVDRGKYLQAKGYSQEAELGGQGFQINASTAEVYGLHKGHIAKLLDLNPLTPCIIPCNGLDTPIIFNIWLGQKDGLPRNLTNINYLGLLGHNLDSAHARIKFSFFSSKDVVDQYSLDLLGDDDIDWVDHFEAGEANNIIGWQGNSGTGWHTPPDGTFLIDISPSFEEHLYKINNPNSSAGDGNYGGTFSEGADVARFGMQVTINPYINFTFERNINLGALTFGTFFDMPHAPNLDMVEKRVFDGINRQKTIGGATVTNAVFTGAPNWTIDAANRISKQQFSSSENLKYEASEGRRVWEISWSSLFDYDLFSPNTDLSWSQQSNDLYTILVSKTLGGQLPFIFEYNTSKYSSGDEVQFDQDWDHFDPDGYAGYGDSVGVGNHMPHHFAIARLTDHSFEASKIAPNLWEIDMELEETW